MIVPLDYDWHLLAGDATAAPAIGRRFAELPRDSEVIVVVQLEDLAVLELDRSQARVELRRVATADEGVAAIEALRLPPGEGYVWCAGEAGAMARARDILLGDKAQRKPLTLRDGSLIPIVLPLIISVSRDSYQNMI